MYTIEPLTQGSYIHITVLRDFDTKQVLRIYQEAHAMGVFHGIRRYLIDVRAAQNISSPIENFQFTQYDALDLPYPNVRVHVALIAAPDDYSHDFTEVVSIDAGQQLRIFRDLNEVLTFLQVAM